MKIDKNSYGTLALIYLISASAVCLAFVLGASLPVKLIVVAAFAFFVVWQTLFFRVPRRNRLGNGNRISAVADGKVVIIEKVFEPEYLRKECMQISIYMDFWDVHANFWPVTGEVTYYRYYPGKHYLAFLPKASSDNEHTCTAIRTANGQEVFYKQISGTFARRIKNYAKPGLKVTAGEQCGIIKFGSRIDMYLPLESEIKVSLEEQTVACETIVAVLPQ